MRHAFVVFGCVVDACAVEADKINCRVGWLEPPFNQFEQFRVRDGVVAEAVNLDIVAESADEACVNKGFEGTIVLFLVRIRLFPACLHACKGMVVETCSI